MAEKPVPDWPDVMSQSGRKTWPCWPDPLAICSLVQGDGMQQDAKEGVKWLMKAAEHGYPPAVELVRRTSSRMNRES